MPQDPFLRYPTHHPGKSRKLLNPTEEGYWRDHDEDLCVTLIKLWQNSLHLEEDVASKEEDDWLYHHFLFRDNEDSSNTVGTIESPVDSDPLPKFIDESRDEDSHNVSSNEDVEDEEARLASLF